MIVPLNFGFSSDFSIVRELLFEQYQTNWFSSFGRIPSALFSFDVRVRNIIYLGSKFSSTHSQFTTRLHRWFNEARLNLFQVLEYASFTPALWRHRIPKLSTQKLSIAFENYMRNTV